MNLDEALAVQVTVNSPTGRLQMNVDISRKQFLRGKFREKATVSPSVTTSGRGEDPVRAEGPAVGIQINSLCLSVSGTTCRLCEDECDRQAIDFKLMTAGRSIPMVNNNCNGCLDCTSVCPVDAIHPVYAPVLDKETLT